MWDDQIKTIASQVIEQGLTVVEKFDEYRGDLKKQKMIVAAGLWMQKELGLYETANDTEKHKAKRKPLAHSPRRRRIRRLRHGK